MGRHRSPRPLVGRSVSDFGRPERVRHLRHAARDHEPTIRGRRAHLSVLLTQLRTLDRAAPVALTGDADPLGARRISSDLLLLPQGVLPLLYAPSARLRGGRRKARRVSRRDNIPADPPESPSLSAVLRVAGSPLSLVRRLACAVAGR